MTEKQPIKQPAIVHTPAQAADLTMQEIERRRHDKSIGVALGIDTVDKALRPLRPGELVTVLGRPSHYKSGLAQWWARRLAQECLQREQNEMIVYVTAEMAIEELMIYDLAVGTEIASELILTGKLTDEQWDTLEAAAFKRAGLPLWLFGHNLTAGRERVQLSVLTVRQALLWAYERMAFRPRAVFLDYLNLLMPDRMRARESRRMDVSDIVYAAKDLALQLRCPVIMLAQAHRHCDERDWKLPEMRDAMETAAIEQYSDKMMSVWYPKVTDHGAIRAPDGTLFEVTDHLLFFGLMKQKNGPAGLIWPLYVDPAHNFIGAYAVDEGLSSTPQPRQTRMAVSTTRRRIEDEALPEQEYPF